MIYSKKTSKFQCDVDAEGGMYDILDELAALLETVHRDCREQDPDMAVKFREYVKVMTRPESTVWGLTKSVPVDTTAAHYERLCQAAEHFGLETQKWKAKEEMTELSVLLRDYRMPDPLLRAARIGELADVYNMLDQLCILWNCEDEVQDMAEQKMIRTMQPGYYDEDKSHAHA